MYSYLNEDNGFDSDTCKFYAAVVITTLEYLHKKNIVYRNLRPENLLIGNDGYLKMIDFRLSKIVNEGRTFTICGTPEYMAP